MAVKRPQSTEPLRDQIMSQIEANQIAVRPRISIFLEYISWGVILVTMLLFLVLAVNLLARWYQVTDHRAFLHLGGFGMLAFWEVLPHAWLILGIFGLTFSLFILRHYDISYKIPYPMVVAVVLFAGIALGMLVTTSGINRPVEKRLLGLEKIDESRKKPITLHHGKHGLLGEVTEVQADRLVVTTPTGSVSIHLTDKTRYIGTASFVVGDTVRVVGRDENATTFEARLIQKIVIPSTSFLLPIPDPPQGSGRFSLRIV